MAHMLIIGGTGTASAWEKGFFEKKGFDVVAAASGKDGLVAAKQGGADVILIHSPLPDGDSIGLCCQIRAAQSVPVFLVAERGCDEEQIKALEAGADDYITAPVSPAVMAARIEACLSMRRRLLEERRTVGEDADICVGDLTIFIRRRQAFRGRTEIPLTVKEFDLLAFLAGHPNQVFSKQELFKQVWHLDASGDLATVTVHINRLREKLNQVSPAFTAIETVWGNGYRFQTA